MTLQELWARLIANSTDPKFHTTIHPGYVEIIKQLTPDEAIIIDALSKAEHYPLVFTAQVIISTGENPPFESPQFFEGIMKDYIEFCIVDPKNRTIV